MSDPLFVSEIFKSIQGEGPYMGMPATFLRLGFCNLHCSWCDAWYTWDKQRVDLKQEIKPLLVEEVMEQCVGAPLLVVTGGEPLLRMHQPWLRELFEAFYGGDRFALVKGAPSTIQFETNGTVLPDIVERVNLWNLKYVVSPKTSNNGADSKEKRIVARVLEWFAARPHRCFFKFVVASPEDYKEIEEIVQQFQIQPSSVYLMPEGVDSKTLTAKGFWVAEEAKRRGWNYSDRLQIRLYGNVRGT